MSEVVVVTGAAGFLGFHLAEHYLKKNYMVIGVDNLITGTAKNVQDLQRYSGFQFIRHSVEDDWYIVDQFMKVKNLTRIKYIFHFASVAEPTKFQTHFPEIMKANSQGTMNVLDFASRYKARVVYASTSEIYGNASSAAHAETEYGHVNPVGVRSCYNASKRFAESYISHTNQVYKTQHGIVRIFNTYGPRMNPNETRVIVAMVMWALRNQDIQIYGKDQRSRSFCYVDDLIQGVVNYADSMIQQPMNLGNDAEISIIDLANKIIQFCRSKSKIVFNEARLDEAEKRKPNLQFAKTKLNYKTTVELDEGLLKTIEFLKKNAPTRLEPLGQQRKVDHGHNTEQIG